MMLGTLNIVKRGMLGRSEIFERKMLGRLDIGDRGMLRRLKRVEMRALATWWLIERFKKKE